ncbi:MAG: hypothetical protein ACR2MC_00750 [Actinomycetota bacterium]
MNDDHNNDLELVRKTLRDSTMFSPSVTAQIDALRASVHEQLTALGIDPHSRECEQVWVAGGALAQMIASDNVPPLFSSISGNQERGAVAANLFWASGISPYPTEKLPG